MPNQTVPLSVPRDLYDEVRQASKKTRLSMADVMRQSMRLGLPSLVSSLGETSLKPFTRQEWEQCYGKANREFDALESHSAKHPPVTEEFDE